MLYQLADTYLVYLLTPSASFEVSAAAAVVSFVPDPHPVTAAAIAPASTKEKNFCRLFHNIAPRFYPKFRPFLSNFFYHTTKKKGRVNFIALNFLEFKAIKCFFVVFTNGFSSFFQLYSFISLISLLNFTDLSSLKEWSLQILYLHLTGKSHGWFHDKN